MGDVKSLLLQALDLFRQGRLAEAGVLARKCLDMSEGQAEASHLLGLIAVQCGNNSEAGELIARAIHSNPRYVEAHFNYGHVLRNLGRMVDALSAYDRVIQLDPCYVDAHFYRSNVLWELGEKDSALEACERTIQLNPQRVAAHYNRGNMLRELDRENDALLAYEQAVKINPRHIEARYNHAALCQKLGRRKEALDGFEQTIKLSPEMVKAHVDRGNVLWGLCRGFDALNAYDRAIQLDPAFPEAYYNRGNVLLALGYFSKAETSYRRALEVRPDYMKAHSNLLSLLAATAILPPLDTLEEQRRWDKVHGKDGRMCPLPVYVREASLERRLRVGYVSPDLCGHVVSYFFEPLLAAHDRTRVEVFCYACHEESLSDRVTDRLRESAENWRFVAGASDEELADLIQSDKIDILVDLAGHTASSRLKVFTYRPAPVQATYLGFYAPTGLESMDYWITDEVLHPYDTPEQAVETIYRLPRCWVCYQPPAGAPAVSACPNADERVVFGSFARLSKLTPGVIETWSRLLSELPGSRLLIMDRYLADSKTRQMLLDRFASHGISSGRLILNKGVPFNQYLAAYANVDIMLDPFPRTGGTTTAESLWMGVPVITLAGQRYAGRISASKLKALGLDELIATSRESYIKKTVLLARDPARRKKYRKELRERMAHSPLCDGKSLAQAMEAAYLDMWEHFTTAVDRH